MGRAVLPAAGLPAGYAGLALHYNRPAGSVTRGGGLLRFRTKSLSELASARLNPFVTEFHRIALGGAESLGIQPPRRGYLAHDRAALFTLEPCGELPAHSNNLY